MLRRRLLAIADAVAAILMSASLAWLPGGSVDAAFWSAVFVPCWILVAKVHGLYDADHRALRHLTVDELPRIFGWALTGTAILLLFLWVVPASLPETPAVLAGFFAVASSAAVLRGTSRALWRRLVPRERALIIGTGAVADATRRKLELFPDMHVDVVDQRDEWMVDDGDISSGAPANVDRILLASQWIDEGLIAELLRLCRRDGVKLSIVPPARGMFGTAVRLSHVADLPLVEYNTWDVSRSTLFLKRTMDVAMSAVLLLLASPFLIAGAIAIRIETRGPILFVQRRAGLGGVPFRMYKLRTMTVDAEDRLATLVPFEALRDPMFKLQNDPRVTRVGRILRRTSIDELPQLFNVLRGDMSLVGPRPEQVELVERYAPEHRFRLDVKPGITGPMQVYGRGQLTFEERLAVEREYIENLSLARDLRILALTFVPLVSGRGAY